MATLAEILKLPLLHGARVVAGHRGLGATVRWCHVAEVLDIARTLAGRELLLTTGLALRVPPEQQAAYVRELHRAGVVGLMLELGRQFKDVPSAMVTEAETVGLPLIALPFDTSFVQVVETVHTVVLSESKTEGTRVQSVGPMQPRAERLMGDLLAGLIVDSAHLIREVQSLGLSVPRPPWLALLTADADGRLSLVADAAAAEGGRCPWLVRHLHGEVHLLAFAAQPDTLTQFLSSVARRLAPVAVGASRCYVDPQAAARGLAEARQTMLLRRSHPGLHPLFVHTGVYRLGLEHAGYAELKGFAAGLLEPLVEYDRVNGADLCQTLRVLLDDGMGITEAARHLHLSRQGLYNRRRRIVELLGCDLEDAEVRLALAVALRLRDVESACGPSPAR